MINDAKGVIMLKVFLVEDEIVVREGIKNQINWEQEGFQFIGEASDGELAYPMIQTLKPDIVITDIKMPFVDGLELSRMIKEIQPEIKIIILSGYGEFDYAKEAIKIGITDYLLKPISSERLLDAVKAVGRSIEEERKQKNILFQFQEELQEKQERERQQLLYDLVSKEIPIKELGERAKELNLDLFACMYNIVLFKVYLSGDNIHSYSEHLVEVEDQIEQYLEKQDKVIFFRRQTEGSVLLFKVDSEQEFDTYSKKVMLGMVELLGKYNDLEYFFGIGKLVQRIREIPESFEEANRAFSYRYMVNNQHYITYEQIGTLNKNSEEEINLDLMDSAKIDRAIITNFLKSGLEEEVKHFLYDYFVGLGLSNLNSLLFRQYVALDLYLTTIGFLDRKSVV